MLNALVVPSAARRKAILDAGQTVPQPFKIRALVDTGASNTCVDPAVTAALGLAPTGQVLCNTPSSGATPHQANQYDVGILIPATQAHPPLFRDTLAVMEADLLTSQGFHALIGRDVLGDCILTYNGSAGLFMLAF
jgi:hypothetical protein